jgi:hypothetical protein
MQERVSADQRLLMDEGLFVAVDPSPLLYHTRTSEPFIEELEWAINARLEHTRRRGHAAMTDSLLTEFVPIYREKTSEAVLQRLREDNLVRRSSDSHLLLFRKDVAAIYMALLAKHVAAMPENRMVPATNKKVQIDLAFNDGRNYVERESIRCLTFTHLIPVPLPGTAIEDIVRFRKAHRNELLAFRHQKAMLERRVAQLEDPRALPDEIEGMRREIEMALGNLLDAFKSNRIETREGSLAAFLKPFTPNLVGSTVTAGAAAQWSDLVSVPLAVSASVGTAILQGAIGVQQHRRKMQREWAEHLRGQPYAYLFLAQQRFGSRTRP